MWRDVTTSRHIQETGGAGLPHGGVAVGR
jgi:hypothetical protein